MRKHLIAKVQHNSALRFSVMGVRFFGNSVNAKIPIELSNELNIARKLAYQGEASEAEKKYKQLIEMYPKCEQIYKELFAVWYDKGSVLGLKQWDIDWLKTKYKENITVDNSSEKTKNKSSKYQSLT